MDGQAESAPLTEGDLAAAFMADNPEGAGNEHEDEATDESPDLTADTEESEIDDDSPADGESDEDEPDAQEEQTSGRKYKVTVKGEDGADLEQEVDEKELIAGYKRHADYTRKTQELAQREEQAVGFVKSKIDEARNHFVQQAQTAHAAVLRLAGLKSPEEMLALSQSDPAAFVQEQARAAHIQGVLNGLNQQIAAANAQAQAAQAEEAQKAFARCWGVIGQKGIDKPRLEHVFKTVHEAYGVPLERFQNLSDPSLVLILNDAVKLRELQAKKPEVMKKAKEAPRLPQKGAAPRSQQANKARDARFSSGRAGRNDLASLFASMK